MVAVVYSLILSLCYRTIKLKDLYKIFKESAETTGIIVFLIGVSGIMAWVLAFTGIPAAISKGLISISDNRIVIMLIINLILLLVGTFMDITPAILDHPDFPACCNKRFNRHDGCSVRDNAGV